MSSTLGFAFLIFVAGLVALSFLEGWLVARTSGVPVANWTVEHVGIPLLRYALLIVFLLAAYPALFGLRQAPPLAEVLFAGEGRLGHLLNLLFVFGVLLPLIPILDRLPVVTLPLHTVVGATLLFFWTSHGTGQPAPLFPGAGAAFGFVLVLGLGHWLGKTLQRAISDEVVGQAVYGAAVMSSQLPAILIYTLPLGRGLT